MYNLLRMATEKKRKVAIFDIDGTIFRSSLLIEVAEALVDAGVLEASVRKSYEAAYKKWRNREGSYEDYIMGVVRAFVANLKNVDYKTFVKISKQVVTRQQNHVYKYTRDLVAELKKKNYYLLAISNSPKVIVEEFGKKMGFDKVYGRMYEVSPEGNFTGQIMHLDVISDKAKTIRRAAEKEGFTLNGSIGVGDTEGDIPMFKIVSKPICFNPNEILYKEAKKRGWQIVVERKDVIYKI